MGCILNTLRWIELNKTWKSLLEMRNHFERWDSMWLLRGWLCVNCLSQNWHSKGFSPLWIRMCTFNLISIVNCFRQIWQLKGLLPLWTLIWRFRLLFWVNCFRQIWHRETLKGLLPLWPGMWTFKLLPWVNCILYKHIWKVCCNYESECVLLNWN